MTKGQRTIATLLVLVAALLGGIAIVQTSSPAEAGTVGGVASGVADDGTCPSDVNGDLVVNVLDLIDLLLDFGAECPGPQLVDVSGGGHQVIVPPPCPADVNEDLSVNVLDLIDLLLAFGSTCPVVEGT